MVAINSLPHRAILLPFSPHAVITEVASRLCFQSLQPVPNVVL